MNQCFRFTSVAWHRLVRNYWFSCFWRCGFDAFHWPKRISDRIFVITLYFTDRIFACWIVVKFVITCRPVRDSFFLHFDEFSHVDDFIQMEIAFICPLHISTAFEKGRFRIKKKLNISYGFRVKSWKMDFPFFARIPYLTQAFPHRFSIGATNWIFIELLTISNCKCPKRLVRFYLPVHIR